MNGDLGSLTLFGNWLTRRACVPFVLLCCGFLPNTLRAQQMKCDSLHPLPGSSSAYKNRGNRCEGLYVADVGSRSIDVISFTAGSINYDLNSKSSLRVSALSNSPSVSIRAVAVTPRTYYRMDTFLKRGSTLVWPITDVLFPEHLAANRIGIFGWTGLESSKTFVPTQVVVEHMPQTPAANGHVMLLAQTSFDADSIKWRWARAQGTGCLAFGTWKDAITHSIIASSPVKIDFNGVAAGVDCVELAARSQVSNGWVTLKIRVEMP
jgi:hypothetical protein